MALAVALGLTACARYRAGDRARAVARLREIDTLLVDLDRAYSAGKRTQAKELATKILFSFDNSIAETVVTEIDRPLHRELEPILEKQLTEEVDAGAPVPRVSNLIARGRALVAQAIREIGR
ncbi:MAG TPA: hypothetical protein VKW09_00475 [bacterium]|nr:hypothetical protein [bacterium]